jgi:hypothetical protein
MKQSRIEYLLARLESINNPEAAAKIHAVLDADKPKRAHDEDGHFASDDKSTKDINEAWKGGKAPKKKRK